MSDKKTDEQLTEIRQNLLKAIDAAMEAYEDLIPCHDKYESYLEDMIPSTDGFKVDQGKLRRFQEVLYFMLVGTFGVDGSDGKSQANVQAHLTNRERCPGSWCIDLPYTYKINDNDDLAWAEILRDASSRAGSAQDDLDRIAKIISSNMRTRGAGKARRRRAINCENPDCKKGLVKAKWKVICDFKKNCTEFQRGHMYDEPDLPTGRVLCDVCQTKERQEELDAQGVA